MADFLFWMLIRNHRKLSQCTIMKKILIAAIAACLFLSCGKDKAGLDAVTIDWPHASIFTIDNGTDWIYLRVASNIIMRDPIAKSYSMADLAREKDCQFEVRLGNVINSRQSYSFHLLKDPAIRMRVRPTASAFGTEEFYVGIHESDTPPSDDSWRFFLHFLSDQDGKKRVKIESVSKPGYFFTNDGHTLNGKGVELKTESDQQAAVFVCHR
jgi:hypothetical protein